MKAALIITYVAMASVVACSDPRCPAGKKKVGSFCHVVGDPNASDAGDVAQGTDEDDDDRVDPGAGETTFDAGTNDWPARDGRAASDAAETWSEDARPNDSNPGEVGSPGNPGNTLEPGDSGTPATSGMAGDACTRASCGEITTCATDPCPEGAACTDTAEGRSCDNCADHPCQNGGTCMSSASGFSCACSPDYSGDRCELEICETLTVRTRADVDANRQCAEIRGDLTFVTNFPEVTADDFPHLTQVTGRLTVSNTGAPAGGTLLVRLALNALEVLEGQLLSVSGTLEEVRLPSLVSVGTSTDTGGVGLQVPLKVLEMPVLTTVQGSFALIGARSLCSINVRRINQIGGDLQLRDLVNLPYSATAGLRTATRGSVTTTNVGCCTFGDTFACQGAPGSLVCSAECL